MRGAPGLTSAERRILSRLSSPERIQRFLDEEVRYNKERRGETARSPRLVLRDRTAHCFEGAVLAAAALRFHGRPPLVLQMNADRDTSHVLALFRETSRGGAWGAVAQSNFSGLRFRSAVFRSLRELLMSYFEQYFNLAGEKTFRCHTRPLDLSRFDARGWVTAGENLWDVSDWVATRRFYFLLTRRQIVALGRVDRRLYLAGMYGSVGMKPAWPYGPHPRGQGRTPCP